MWWKLARFNMQSLCSQIQRYFVQLFCLLLDAGYRLLTLLMFSMAALFSTAAVTCLALGFVTLLSMVLVAIYKSGRSGQFMKRSNKGFQGMV